MATAESSEWERRTWYEFKRLVEEVPEAGVHFQSASPSLTKQKTD